MRVGTWFPLTVDLDVVDLDQIRRNPFDVKGFTLTPEFLWIIGFYIAEGSTDKNRIEFSMHADETYFRKRVETFATNLGYRFDSHSKGDRGWVVRINSGFLSAWFDSWLGHGCANKQIPAELLKLPAAKLEYLIQGIYDGDGKKYGHSIEQTSLQLALQLVEASRRLGNQPTASMHIGSKDGTRDVYRVHEPLRLRSESRSKPFTWQLWDQDLRRIENLERREFDGMVYNLSVENDESYVVEGIPVHNCWDMKRTGEGSHQDHSGLRAARPCALRRHRLAGQGTADRRRGGGAVQAELAQQRTRLVEAYRTGA